MESLKKLEEALSEFSKEYKGKKTSVEDYEKGLTALEAKRKELTSGIDELQKRKLNLHSEVEEEKKKQVQAIENNMREAEFLKKKNMEESSRLESVSEGLKNREVQLNRTIEQVQLEKTRYSELNSAFDKKLEEISGLRK